MCVFVSIRIVFIHLYFSIFLVSLHECLSVSITISGRFWISAHLFNWNRFFSFYCISCFYFLFVFVSMCLFLCPSVCFCVRPSVVPRSVLIPICQHVLITRFSVSVSHVAQVFNCFQMWEGRPRENIQGRLRTCQQYFFSYSIEQCEQRSLRWRGADIDKFLGVSGLLTGFRTQLSVRVIVIIALSFKWFLKQDLKAAQGDSWGPLGGD